MVIDNEQENFVLSFTFTEEISTESINMSYMPSISTDGNGNVHVAWHDVTNYSDSGTDLDIFYKMWNATTSIWTTTEVVSTESNGYSYDPTIAIDGSNNVHVAWTDNTDYLIPGETHTCLTDFDIFYKRWNATTEEWTTTGVVSMFSLGHSSSPSMAILNSGKPVIVWIDNDPDIVPEDVGNDFDIYSTIIHDINGDYADCLSLDSTLYSHSPSISTNGSSLYVVWHDKTNYSGSGTDRDIFYLEYQIPIHPWVTHNVEIVSTESSGASSNPWIAVDSSGNRHVVWEDTSNYAGSGTDSDIFYKRLNATTALWTTTEVVTREIIDICYNPAIATDDSEDVHVVWHQGLYLEDPNMDIFYIKTLHNDIPSITQFPSDIITDASGKETINWVITDNQGGGKYRVLVNNSDTYVWVPWSDWANNTALNVPINRTVPGVFNYTIEYYDLYYLNGSSDTVKVTVLDNLPDLNQPDDIEVQKDDYQTIGWKVTDDFGDGNYRVYINNTPGMWNSWVNNTPIDHAVDTSTIGIFNYTIQIITSTEQMNYDTVIVKVLQSHETIDTNTTGYNHVIFISVFPIIIIVSFRRIKKKQKF